MFGALHISSHQQAASETIMGFSVLFDRQRRLVRQLEA